ncbi:GNAT family N-acetyltransferase [Paenibacillus pedocola]|uniref:GNAT family N-acetyltransferase n=1 Tax=Paenibacillus pedocola TaxID=3242193 RepID=UPI0028772B67|nr:GNAT family N-acetyltransferase [Paenibacillus typhae]
MITYETISLITQQGTAVELRPLQPAEAGRLQALLSHPEVQPHIVLRCGAGSQKAVLDKLVHRMIYAYDPCALHAGIYPRGGEELIGTVSLQNWNRHEGKAVLGYMLHPDWWGAGLASEAVGLLLGYARQELGLAKVEGRCRGDNLRSERVMLKNGLALERILPIADGSGDVMKVFTLLHN